MSKLLTYEQASALLNIPRGTLASMVSRRQIPHVRLGARTVRFHESELLDWLAERRVSAGAGAH